MISFRTEFGAQTEQNLYDLNNLVNTSWNKKIRTAVALFNHIIIINSISRSILKHFVMACLNVNQIGKADGAHHSLTIFNQSQIK